MSPEVWQTYSRAREICKQTGESEEQLNAHHLRVAVPCLLCVFPLVSRNRERALSRVGKSRLSRFRPAKVEHIDWDLPDGTVASGALLLPSDYAGARLPFVIELFGGSTHSASIEVSNAREASLLLDPLLLTDDRGRSGGRAGERRPARDLQQLNGSRL